eukprot:COSAG01_NODE_1289_length_10885_cov_3.769331_12_plen_64_part_00
MRISECESRCGCNMRAGGAQADPRVAAAAVLSKLPFVTIETGECGEMSAWWGAVPHMYGCGWR